MLDFTNSGPVAGAAVVKAVKIPVIGGFGGGPWLDGRVRLAHTAIGYADKWLDSKTDTYVNTAKAALGAFTALIADVRRKADQGLIGMAGDYENKYEPLYDFLMKETRDDFILTYEEIEEILGFESPQRQARRMVDDDTPEHPREQAQAIQQAGIRLCGGVRMAPRFASGGCRRCPSDDRQPDPPHRHGVSRHADAAAVCSAARGYFDQRGSCELKPAPNSEEQRAGLAAGRYQIVHGAADQCVALVEAAKVDAMIVAGGDNGFNHLFVQPEIARIADLRGRSLVADVANTGWSFVLYDILKRHGLCVATSSFTKPVRRSAASRQCATTGRWQRRSSTRRSPSIARRVRLKDICRNRHHRALSRHGPYALRSWANANADTLVGYLALH